MVLVGVHKIPSIRFRRFRNSIFARALLQRLKPTAKVYIIPVADFFQQSEAPEAKVIMQDDAARSRYAVKRRWQFVHKSFCMKLATICGHAFAVFRSHQTGMWYTSPLSMYKSHGRPVSYDEQIDERKIDEAIAVGRIFLSELPVKPECVILTVVLRSAQNLGQQTPLQAVLGKCRWFRKISMACKRLTAFIRSRKCGALVQSLL